MVFGQVRLDSAHFSLFFNRAPKLNAFDQASIVFYDHAVELMLFTQAGPVDSTKLVLDIPCQESDDLLGCLAADVCRAPFPPLSALERLDIYEDSRSPTKWQDDDVQNTHWIEVFRPFTTVMNSYLSDEVAPHVSLALQELDGRSVTEVLPALQHLFLRGSGSLQEEAFAKFVSARQVSGRPVTLHRWE